MASRVKPNAVASPPLGERRDGRVERWREHRITRRAELVEAAMRALAEHGPDASMEQIAAAAGIAKPKIYRHFDDKADLVAAVGARARDTIVTALVAAFDPQGSVREGLQRGLDAYFGFVEEHPNTVKLLMDAAAPGAANAVVENGRIIAGLLIAITSADLDAAHAPTDGVEPLTHALIGSVLGATDWWLLQPADTRMPRTRLVEHLTTVLIGAAQASMRAVGLELDPDAPLDQPHLTAASPPAERG
jgi:AcrR family transcriptional regulator